MACKGCGAEVDEWVEQLRAPLSELDEMITAAGPTLSRGRRPRRPRWLLPLRRADPSG